MSRAPPKAVSPLQSPQSTQSLQRVRPLQLTQTSPDSNAAGQHNSLQSPQSLPDLLPARSSNQVTLPVLSACGLRRCSGPHGCICPRAKCCSCGVEHRLETASRVKFVCEDCVLQRVAERERLLRAASEENVKGIAGARPASRYGSPESKKKTKQAHPAFIEGHPVREQLMRRFRTLDTNDDGHIERDDLLSVLQGLSNQWSNDRVDATLTAMDTSKDVRIQYEEFVPWSYAADVKNDPPQQAFLYSTGALEWNFMRHQSNERDRQARERIAARGRRGIPPVPW